MKRTLAEGEGKIKFEHDAAGGSYGLVIGENHYTIRYLWELSNSEQTILSELDNADTIVVVKGTLKIYGDGSSSFDNKAPVSIYR